MSIVDEEMVWERPSSPILNGPLQDRLIVFPVQEARDSQVRIPIDCLARIVASP